MEMRQIKFKAKRLDNGEWVEGYYYSECGKSYIFEDRQKETMLHRNHPYEIDPSTICQFTGLKDCMLEDIWEGDIIKNSEFPFEERTVTWVNHQSCFMPMDEDGCQDRDFSFLALFKNWTVVGNKFDRKEGEK